MLTLRSAHFLNTDNHRHIQTGAAHGYTAALLDGAHERVAQSVAKGAAVVFAAGVRCERNKARSKQTMK